MVECGFQPLSQKLSRVLSYMPRALSPLPKERDFESFSGSPRPSGEGLGVRAKTTVLNVDLVYHPLQ